MEGGIVEDDDHAWLQGKHAVNRAAIMLDGGSLFLHALARGNDAIPQVIDTEVGEGQDIILADADDPQASMFRHHRAGNLPQTLFVFAEHFGYMTDGIDTADRDLRSPSRLPHLCGAATNLVDVSQAVR